MKYLLDTNICIYLIKQKSEKIVNKIKEFGIDELSVSSITVAELEYGIQKSNYHARNKLALTEFLVPFKILDFNHTAAVDYGEIRADLEREGRVIGPLDLLIAAHARVNGLTIVTNNEKEFCRVKGLEVENWTK